MNPPTRLTRSKCFYGVTEDRKFIYDPNEAAKRTDECKAALHRPDPNDRRQFPVRDFNQIYLSEISAFHPGEKFGKALEKGSKL